MVAVQHPCARGKWVCRWPSCNLPSEQHWVPVASRLTRPKSRESIDYFSSGNIIASLLKWNFHSRCLLITMSEAREWEFLKLTTKNLSDSLRACFLINVIWQNLVENFFFLNCNIPSGSKALEEEMYGSHLAGERGDWCGNCWKFPVVESCVTLYWPNLGLSLLLRKVHLPSLQNLGRASSAATANEMNGNWHVPCMQKLSEPECYSHDVFSPFLFKLRSMW